MPTIYASLPLSGPARHLGRELLQSAQLALVPHADGAVELLARDSGGEAREERAADAARQAAEDPDAVAYLGDLHSSQVAQSSRILGAAGLLQVAPAATWAELGGPTLVRLMPHDGVGARAIADWLVTRGVSRLLVVHDHDPYYGVPVGGMCIEAALDRGVGVRSRPIWNHDEAWEGDLAGAQALLYVGVAGSGAVQLWDDLNTANPDLWLLGTEGVAEPWLAEAMSPSAAGRTLLPRPARADRLLRLRGHGAHPRRGRGGGGDRKATVRAARAITDRDSILGRYSLDADGHTTTTAYGELAVVDGELVSA